MAVAIRELALSRVTEGGQMLGGVLRKIRRERGWTQRQVAERWNLTVDGYRPYEQGRRQLRWSQIPSLAKALDMDELELAQRLGMNTVADGQRDDQAELSRTLAAMVVSDLAELLAELKDIPPDGWRETIETWRQQPAYRRQPAEN